MLIVTGKGRPVRTPIRFLAWVEERSALLSGAGLPKIGGRKVITMVEKVFIRSGDRTGYHNGYGLGLCFGAAHFRMGSGRIAGPTAHNTGWKYRCEPAVKVPYGLCLRFEPSGPLLIEGGPLSGKAVHNNQKS